MQYIQYCTASTRSVVSEGGQTLREGLTHCAGMVTAAENLTEEGTSGVTRDEAIAVQVGKVTLLKEYYYNTMCFAE